ncbi:uncharacterized protein LOC122258165 [Penaeus japonicus]|uniref:uncharacterized protein LOC122258165 n=1 Tax=Penaeus japonicus TaxID=27405 RepID=UPI001C70BD19|nr:uncharacterized protein LOC122258165 [Penaeus japonicus]
MHRSFSRSYVVAGSSSELERLEVLLGKLRTLYSWSPVVSSLSITALGTEETLSAMDTAEEVFALLVRLAQLRQSNTVVGGAALVGGPGDVENGQGDPVVQVKELLEYWLKAIRSDPKSSQAVPVPNPDPDEEEEGEKEAEDPDGEEASSKEGGGSEGVAPGGQLTPDPNASAAVRPNRTPDTHEGDTGDEEEAQTIAALQTQVREAVARVGAAGRSGGGGGGEGGASEADLDVGRELKWRKMALTRLKEYRNREDTRTTKLVDYKAKHSLPLEEEGHRDEGGGGEVEQPFDIENEVVVPPPSVTVRAVEGQLWTLLGNIEIECKKIREQVNRIARIQENLLQQVNQFREEWGHALFTLPHLPHHLQVQVSDELVNEFYCDLLELEECDDADVDGAGARAARNTDDAHAPATSSGAGRRGLSRKGSAGTDVPPLSLAATPRAGKTSKAPQTARSPRAITTARTPSNSTSRTPRTTQRSGRGRRSVRESPKPPPTPRPPMSLEQVQMIQRRRTTYLCSLTQVPEQMRDFAREVDHEISQCRRAVVGERGRLTWAVLRAGQLVKAVGVRVKYKEGEKKLRLELQEKIQERHVIKEKVLALRERIHEYDLDLECLEGLENEVDQAFAHLVTDHAQFEVQLTRYFESRSSAGPARRDSVSSRSSGDGGEDDGDESGDNDSGLGSDEARVGGEEGGPRPPGCDPAVFSLVTVLRDLRWRVVGAVERVRKEKAVEDRRHTAVLRRLMRANHLTHAALASLKAQEAAREAELGAIPTVVWLRKSQTSGNLSAVTRLPIPNTEMDSLAAVRWVGEGGEGGGGEATLLTGDHLRQLEHRVAMAKKTQDLAAKKRREGRAERRYLAMQVEQLRRKLDHLHNTCQVSRECKLGVGAEADLTAVEDKLAASLDLRWPGKIASQQARHVATMKQLQAEVSGRTRELRALQREEAALAAHILALRQEKDHLLYHLAQTPSPSRGLPPAVHISLNFVPAEVCYL